MQSLKEFYFQSPRLGYNPQKTLWGKRTGLRRLISFDDRFATVTQKLTEIISKEKKRKLKILDVGVGDGIYESLLPKTISDRCEFFGIDISPGQLARAKEFLQEVKAVDLNTQAIPYNSGFFDIVLVSEILEHVFFPDKVLKEALRVLRKGGHLLLTYPNAASLQLRTSLFFWGRSPLLNYPENLEHIRFFSRANILAMIGKSAKLIYYQGLGSFLFGKWNFPLKAVTPRLMEIFGNKVLPGLALGNLMVFRK